MGASNPATPSRQKTILAPVAGALLVLALALAAALAPAATPGAGAQEPHPVDPGRAGYEVWALDQGTALVHVYHPTLTELGVIDLAADAVALGAEVATPHMIDFDSAHRYAFIANTGSGNVAIVCAADRTLVDVVETGATAHLAAVTPDDSAVWVANIGAKTFTEITLDLDTETFAVGRELDLAADPLYQEVYGDWEAPPAPVCHEYTAHGRHAYLTLGPGAGGLVVVDLEEVRLVEAFDPELVRANCGLARSPDGGKMYANWGSPAQHVGEWYVFDTATHALTGSGGSGGVDAHGVRLRPRSPFLWMVNRAPTTA